MDIETLAKVVYFLHILVFVYWLGGDLGAYYASYYATDASLSAPQRALSLAIIHGVDKAPAIALLMAFPSGLVLAALRGWLLLDYRWVTAVALTFLVWLKLALYLHDHSAQSAPLWRRLDTGLRIAAIILLVAVAVMGMARWHGMGVVAPPLFISLKCVLLALCFALGLLIRRALRPLMAAFTQLSQEGSTPAIESALSGAMRNCRHYVLGIWACLAGAAALGVFKPI